MRNPIALALDNICMLQLIEMLARASISACTGVCLCK